MKSKKRLRRERDQALAERDKAVSDLAAARHDRTLYIRALLERLVPELKELPTMPELKAESRPGVFQVILHGVDGKTLFVNHVPSGSGLDQMLFMPYAITGFTLITPDLVWQGSDG